EIERLDQLAEALSSGADIIMLDNMSNAEMATAVRLCAGSVILEASGGITENNIRAVAQTGVDVISVGWLTQSAPAMDVALDFATGLAN
ncbi:Quinolinate phosphoribosyltransferase [decarboxylating], partial [hydrothermal vent metagenome]